MDSDSAALVTTRGNTGSAVDLDETIDLRLRRDLVRNFQPLIARYGTHRYDLLSLSQRALLHHPELLYAEDLGTRVGAITIDRAITSQQLWLLSVGTTTDRTRINAFEGCMGANYRRILHSREEQGLFAGYKFSDGGLTYITFATPDIGTTVEALLK